MALDAARQAGKERIRREAELRAEKERKQLERAAEERRTRCGKSSPGATQDTQLEQRVAPDGHTYTRAEFIDYFGGTKEWDTAAPKTSAHRPAGLSEQRPAASTSVASRLIAGNLSLSREARDTARELSREARRELLAAKELAQRGKEASQNAECEPRAPVAEKREYEQRAGREPRAPVTAKHEGEQGGQGEQATCSGGDSTKAASALQAPPDSVDEVTEAAPAPAPARHTVDLN